MDPVVYRIVKEDQLRLTFYALRSYLRYLQQILKNSPYPFAEIDTIPCYLIHGIHADLAGGMFHVFYDTGEGRVKIGIVTKSRQFINEIYQAYRHAVQ